jgi:hypothetical protein
MASAQASTTAAVVVTNASETWFFGNAQCIKPQVHLSKHTFHIIIE